MKVVKEGIKEVRQIAEPGDIVEWDTGSEFAIVTEALIVNGNSGLNAVDLNGKRFGSNIQKNIDEGRAKLYKASEYELALCKKEGVGDGRNSEVQG